MNFIDFLFNVILFISILVLLYFIFNISDNKYKINNNTITITEDFTEDEGNGEGCRHGKEGQRVAKTIQIVATYCHDHLF